ncbi:hypothetical protein GCM10009638_05330 [Luteococcus sanguinis]
MRRSRASATATRHDTPSEPAENNTDDLRQDAGEVADGADPAEQGQRGGSVLLADGGHAGATGAGEEHQHVAMHHLAFVLHTE